MDDDRDDNQSSTRLKAAAGGQVFGRVPLECKTVSRPFGDHVFLADRTHVTRWYCRRSLREGRMDTVVKKRIREVLQRNTLRSRNGISVHVLHARGWPAVYHAPLQFFQDRANSGLGWAEL